MVQVFLNDVLIAEGDNTIVVENNHYFPPDTIKKEYFSDSNTHSTCPWKGAASYYNITIGDTTVNDVAWYYPTPSDAAQNIKDHVAFYKNKVVIRQ